mmetsp:Transcript_29898/g.84235  ORF Transcript_29898/g.84235 Transcript_29898/m.84235 type:complete len:331 (-) Transcript_29898:146-1138(-)
MNSVVSSLCHSIRLPAFCHCTVLVSTVVADQPFSVITPSFRISEKASPVVKLHRPSKTVQARPAEFLQVPFSIFSSSPLRSWQLLPMRARSRRTNFARWPSFPGSADSARRPAISAFSPSGRQWNVPTSASASSPTGAPSAPLSAFDSGLHSEASRRLARRPRSCCSSAGSSAGENHRARRASPCSTSMTRPVAPFSESSAAPFRGEPGRFSASFSAISFWKVGFGFLFAESLLVSGWFSGPGTITAARWMMLCFAAAFSAGGGTTGGGGFSTSGLALKRTTEPTQNSHMRLPGSALLCAAADAAVASLPASCSRTLSPPGCRLWNAVMS